MVSHLSIRLLEIKCLCYLPEVNECVNFLEICKAPQLLNNFIQVDFYGREKTNTPLISLNVFINRCNIRFQVSFSENKTFIKNAEMNLASDALVYHYLFGFYRKPWEGVLNDFHSCERSFSLQISLNFKRANIPNHLERNTATLNAQTLREKNLLNWLISWFSDGRGRWGYFELWG